MEHSAAMPAIERSSYRGWDAWWIRSGPLALALVPAVGGRVMGLGWHGIELAFSDPALHGRTEDTRAHADPLVRKTDLGFPYWGGDKTWVAPQAAWPGALPYYDLDSGAYAASVEESPGTIRLVSPVCRESGLQVIRTVGLDAGAARWSVTHRLENKGTTMVDASPWGVSMLRRPARVYVAPADGAVTAYPEEGDSVAVQGRVTRPLGDNVVEIRCDEATKFKYGARAAPATILAVFEAEGRLIGHTKTVAADLERAYPHGQSIEVFNQSTHDYFEAEVHRPAARLEPGQAAEMIETLALFDVETWPETGADVRRLMQPDGASAP